MKRVNRKAPQIVTYNTVFPKDLNHNQELFAGRYVEEMEKAAFFAATKFCQRNVVSASIESLDFLRSVPCGAVLRTQARVVFASTRSMVARARLYAEDRFTGADKLCASGHFILVGLDEDGNVAQLPELCPDSDIQLRDWETGKSVYERSKARRTPER